MRELTSFEVSSISAGEKAISDMTVTDFLPYVTALGSACAFWMVGGSEMVGKTLPSIAKVVPYVGATVGLIGGWVGGKVVAENLSPYL